MELFHVLNRGVEKRTLFLDDRDRLRFVCGLELFNDSKPIEISSAKSDWAADFMQKGPTRSLKRKKLVDIHGWCLMGNHYHLLLSECAEDGLTRFITKLNVGYAKYFNEKYKRSGTLYQGRTKKILIDRDAHFLHILHYIHFNPLDFLKTARSWRAGHVGSSRTALAHLLKYRWSSYCDYVGKKNFPFILTTDLFSDVYGNYKNAAAKYLADIEIEQVEELLLE